MTLWDMIPVDESMKANGSGRQIPDSMVSSHVPTTLAVPHLPDQNFLLLVLPGCFKVRRICYVTYISHSALTFHCLSALD